MSILCGPAKWGDSIVFCLINGADVNQQNNEGETPLKVAEMRRYSEVVRCLSMHAAIVKQSNKNEATTTAHAAEESPRENVQKQVEMDAMCEHPEVIQNLLGNGADVNQAAENGEILLLKEGFHLIKASAHDAALQYFNEILDLFPTISHKFTCTEHESSNITRSKRTF